VAGRQEKQWPLFPKLQTTGKFFFQNLPHWGRKFPVLGEIYANVIEILTTRNFFCGKFFSGTPKNCKFLSPNFLAMHAALGRFSSLAASAISLAGFNSYRLYCSVRLTCIHFGGGTPYGHAISLVVANAERAVFEILEMPNCCCGQDMFDRVGRSWRFSSSSAENGEYFSQFPFFSPPRLRRFEKRKLWKTGGGEQVSLKFGLKCSQALWWRHLCRQTATSSCCGDGECSVADRGKSSHRVRVLEIMALEMSPTAVRSRTWVLHHC